jgi:hypothetical protein
MVQNRVINQYFHVRERLINAFGCAEMAA